MILVFVQRLQPNFLIKKLKYMKFQSAIKGELQKREKKLNLLMLLKHLELS